MAKGFFMEILSWWLDWWVQRPVVNTLFTFGFFAFVVLSFVLKIWQ